MFSWNFFTFALLFFVVGEAWMFFNSHKPGHSIQQAEHIQQTQQVQHHNTFIPFVGGGDKK